MAKRIKEFMLDHGQMAYQMEPLHSLITIWFRPKGWQERGDKNAEMAFSEYLEKKREEGVS